MASYTVALAAGALVVEVVAARRPRVRVSGMARSIEHDLEEALAHKRGGGVPVDVGVSHSVWLGGILDDRAHEPFVYLGAAGLESDEELSFLRDRATVEALIHKLRAAADQAWGAASEDR